MTEIIQALQWRYATKKFDASKKLTDEQLSKITDALVLSPSSYGLQAWKFLVITNPEIRAELRNAAYGQAQITDASHLVVFTVPKVVDEKTVANYIASVSKIRGVSVDDLKDYSAMLSGALTNKTPEQRVEWVTKQLYIALGVMLTTAAVEGIDACPMEGFDNAKFDEILKLDQQGLATKVIATIGFRASDDAYSTYKKVRFGFF